MGSGALREQTIGVDPNRAAGSAALLHALRIALVTVLALVATAAVLFFVPRTYESTARLIVEVSATERAQDASARIASQVGLITSRDLLLQVVDAENLRSVHEFSNAGASPLTMLARLVGMADGRSLDEVVLANLADRIIVAREGESAVISITARAGEPGLAAAIANRLARTHVDGWAAREAADSAGATTRLEQEIADLRARVAAAEGKVASYRIENGIAGAPVRPAVGDISGAAAGIVQAQLNRENAEQRVRVIRKLLETGEPLNGVAELGNSAVMALLMQSRATLQAELAQKQTTLLPNHPTIKALNAQIAQLEAQIRTEAGKIADSLEAEARIAAEHEQALRDAATTDQAAAGEAAATAVSLETLEREAKTQRDLLDSYLATYAELVAAGNARTARQDIRIISDAAPAGAPSSPNYLLVLAAVGAAVLVLQLGAALLPRRQGVPARVLDDLERDMAEMVAFATEPEQMRPVDQMPEPPAADDSAEPEVEPEPAELDALAALSQDLLAQQQRIVLLAGIGHAGGVIEVIERVLEDAIMENLSAVVVDAASGRVTDVPGLTDLAAGAVDYGDVLQRIGENLAEVQWGQLGALDLHSSRPLTLLEALADIYHVVLVDTGVVDRGTSLPVFTGAAASMLLVAPPDTPAALVEGARQAVAALGFAGSRVVHLARMRAEVA